MTYKFTANHSKGLTDEWVTKIEAATNKRMVYMVLRKIFRLETENVLHELDIILQVSDTIITSITDLDVSETWPERVDVVILRNSKTMKLNIPTYILDPIGTSHVVFWAGAVLQDPHTAALYQTRKLPSRIYVSGRSKGSPAAMYNLSATQWITHVNDVKVVTLQDFVLQVSTLPDNKYVRIKTVSFDGVPALVSIKMNFHYWPTSQV
jgi:S1-C subfamily serine protease